jgi:hypothetical protein
MRAARYMTLAEFRQASVHRSDRCLQSDAAQLWQSAARSSLTSRR